MAESNIPQAGDQDVSPEQTTAGPVTGPSAGRRRVRAGVIAGVAALTLVGGVTVAFASGGSRADGVATSAFAAAPTDVTAPTSPATPTDSDPTGAAPDSASPADPAAPASPDGERPEAKVRVPHLDGTVTSATSTKIVIKDRDGFTRTILVDSDTVYTDDLTADIAEGTVIRAEGAVADDGTSLDATTVGLDRRPEGRPGMGGPGKGGRGFGGPGDGPGHGGPGMRPDGSAPTPPTDGSAPTPPTDGSAPTPPTDGTAPTAPTSSAPTSS